MMRPCALAFASRRSSPCWRSGRARPPAGSAAAPQGSLVVRTLWSPALGHGVRTLVYLPPSYDPNGPALPTLYLLHGTPGTPDGLFALGVADRLDRLIDSGHAPPMLVVAPSGGRRPDSDTEWDDSVADAGARWGTFVTRDLVDAIDADYPTRRGRGSRAIAGISMGGYGSDQPGAPARRDLRRRRKLVGLLPLQHARASTARRARRPGERARRCCRSRSGRRPSAGSRSRRRSTPDGPTASSPRTSPSHGRSRQLGIPHRFRAVPGGHDAAVWRAQMATELTWIGRQFRQAP